MTLIQAALAIVVLTAALRYGKPLFVWVQLMRLRFTHRRVRVVEPNALPSLLEPVFKEAATTLESLGFEYSHAQWTPPLTASEPARPAHVYVHAETGSYAEVAPPMTHTGRRPYTVSFTTVCAAGRVVVTVDGMRHMIPLHVPGVELHDPYVDDVMAQWRTHRTALGDERGVTLSASAYASAEESRQRACIEAAAEGGEVYEATPGRWRLHPYTAWRATLAMLAGANVTEARAKESTRSDSARAAGAVAVLAAWNRLVGGERVNAAPATEARVAADAWSFDAIRRAQPAPTGRGAWIGFAISAVAFAIAFGVLFSWSAVPALFIVVLFHELGHLAGMAMFGYRDRRILMLPLIGGAAIGRKDDATPAERTAVYLLGPVPGLLLGAACLWFGPSGGWLRELGTWAVALNYLNLLPITPLDGGRVVEALFLERHPRAAAAFVGLSALTLALGGLALGDSIVVAIALLLALALPSQWRASRVAAAVRNRLERKADAGAAGADPNRLRMIFEVLRRHEFRHLEAASRNHIARTVLGQLAVRPPGRSLMAAGGALYLFLLLAPAGGPAVFLSTIERRATAADTCELVDRLAAEPAAPPSEMRDALVALCADPAYADLSPSVRWATLMGHAEAAIFRHDHAAAVPYFQLAADAARQAWGAGDRRYLETTARWQESLDAIDAQATITETNHAGSLIDGGS